MTDQKQTPTASYATLDDLRREIDRVDEAIHDAIMRRADIVARVGRAKKTNGHGSFQPSREAEILRRLVARHTGPLPKASLVHVWRELFGAMLRLQGPFSVAVIGSAPGLWTLAHDHFGGQTTIATVDSAGAVLRAVGDVQAQAGVLPVPRQDDRDPWWRQLLTPKMPRVVARLPFGPPQLLRGGPVEAFVVNGGVPAKSGNDRSLVVFETAGMVSQSGLVAALKGVELQIVGALAWRDDRPAAPWLHLVEIEGFVTEQDPRLAGLRKLQSEAIRQRWSLGAYAVPFTAVELEPTAGS